MVTIYMQWLSPNKTFLPDGEHNIKQDISMLRISEKLCTAPAQMQLVF
jgi:hypothetical protein